MMTTTPSTHHTKEEKKKEKKKRGEGRLTICFPCWMKDVLYWTGVAVPCFTKTWYRVEAITKDSNHCTRSTASPFQVVDGPILPFLIMFGLHKLSAISH